MFINVNYFLFAPFSRWIFLAAKYQLPIYTWFGTTKVLLLGQFDIFVQHCLDVLVFILVFCTIMKSLCQSVPIKQESESAKVTQISDTGTVAVLQYARDVGPIKSKQRTHARNPPHRNSNLGEVNGTTVPVPVLLPTVLQQQLGVYGLDRSWSRREAHHLEEDAAGAGSKMQCPHRTLCCCSGALAIYRDRNWTVATGLVRSTISEKIAV